MSINFFTSILNFFAIVSVATDYKEHCRY